MDPNHTCLAVISLDSALKKDENYHLQVFLKSVYTLEISDILLMLKSSFDSEESDEELLF